jgi:type II secretory pathway pseudopilin PulG
MAIKIKGFTFIGLIVILGIIGILVAIIIVVVKPERQYSVGRNTVRRSDTNALLNAIYAQAKDNNNDLADDVKKATTPTCLGTAAACIDLSQELVISGNYITEMPLDPSGGTTEVSGYTIKYDATAKKVTISALRAELDQPINFTK